ncbi:MAG TPA: arginine--tRNA ligase [Patescibacteria group bacterium]|nr:arginine--tRNA ligase [Patescibacteria group bacterium]
MTARELIAQSLKQATNKLSDSEVVIEVLPSDKSSNGDYYSNISLRLAGVLKQKPLDIAYKLKEELEKNLPKSLVEKVEVAPPGFINVFLSNKALEETIEVINKSSNFGNSETLKDKKVIIEFTDPNPFKEFHIGHVYSNIVGESLARLAESQGAEVKRVCYQGDVGLHVAKAIYGMKDLVSEMPEDDAPLSNRAQFLGKCYAFGATKYEANEEIKKEINQINKKVYEATDPDINALYEKGRSWSLEYFDSIYERLGCKFENFYFESQVGVVGIEIVKEFLSKGVFEESEGAIIFPGKKHGLHNRVFINSLGLPTYEAKELGLAPTKYKDFAYDKSIILTGNEIDEYFKVLLKALSFINPELAEKTVHISHGMVRLPSGKMSSRTGDVITGEWLMDEAVSRVQKAYPDMDDEIAEKVGMAAIKFAFLKVGVGRDVEFNFDESISLEGASGPYLQYTYVRTQSILTKNLKLKTENENSGSKNQEQKTNSEEHDLMRFLVYFPEVLTQANNKLSPNLVSEYLFNLAHLFNLFYQKHKIVGNKNRLELTKAVGIVLRHGLSILGIETVEKM